MERSGTKEASILKFGVLSSVSKSPFMIRASVICKFSFISDTYLCKLYSHLRAEKLPAASNVNVAVVCFCSEEARVSKVENPGCGWNTY